MTSQSGEFKSLPYPNRPVEPLHTIAKVFRAGDISLRPLVELKERMMVSLSLT